MEYEAELSLLYSAEHSRADREKRRADNAAAKCKELKRQLGLSESRLKGMIRERKRSKDRGSGSVCRAIIRRRKASQKE